MVELIRNKMPDFCRPQELVNRYIAGISKNIIVSGPFADMRFLKTAENSSRGFCQLILGTYEIELHPVIDSLCQKPFYSIINIGAAEGYYAVGFAFRNPKVQVIAFETKPTGRSAIEKNAAINNVRDRINIKGTCTLSALSEILLKSVPGEKQLMILDVEGGEKDFLAPEILPAIRHKHILVELHAFIHPKIESILKNRFSDTHQIKTIDSEPRTIENFPPSLSHRTWFIPKKYKLGSIYEHRPQAMRWLYLRPKLGR